MYKIKTFSVLLFSTISIYSMDISSAMDSIKYDYSGKLKLKNSFIIPESVVIDSNLSIDSIDFVSGHLYINSNNNKIKNFVKVKYDYIVDGLPVVVGNNWDNVKIIDKKPNKNIFSAKTKPNHSNNNDIYTNGSIYRKISLSKTNGSDFSGGMQMQLNGDIGKNINFSGVLNDEGGFLQADGYTKDLEEFDQIYLNISNKDFIINAGNIVYNSTYNQQHIINRKLTGIKNKLTFNKWEGSSAYASSRGLYNTISFKGKDGKQGPYKLLGKNGEREVVILSGSETVWINGEKITRGYLNDYTIDYSLAEVNFTSNILIRKDLDIFIEYQYIDNNYTKGFSGGSLTKKNNNNT
ncbi:MAG: hypothetical protein CMG04_08410, partial [Candidatus Marinimicrobia bacterium]|nr:hypothetical protein [Candidatus Neomarinimicrobiota bacterium]